MIDLDTVLQIQYKQESAPDTYQKNPAKDIVCV